MNEIKQIKDFVELQKYCELKNTKVIDKRNHLVILDNWELLEFNAE